MGLNVDFRGDMPVTNSLSQGTAHDFLMSCIKECVL
jgi:hypothetical protein